MCNNVVLIGFMGAGKTSVGRALAQICNSILIDTDSIIEANYGISVNEIFALHGEEVFRKYELKLCEFLKNNVKNAIISTGGGIPMRYNLREIGSVFYLQAPLEALVERIQSDTSTKRPVFRRYKFVGDLYNERIQSYEKQADYTINALDSINSIAQEIYNLMKGKK